MPFDVNPGGVEQQYPRWPSQPAAGDPGNPDLTYPYDLWPSSHNPAYSTHMRSATRTLAGLGGQPGGLGAMNAEETPDADYETLAGSLAKNADGASMQDYPGELESLSRLDDTQGNGIFDAHNSYPNVNEDAGVFADQWALPGYVAREKMFAGGGEVIDVNTGRPVVYIPATEFQIDRRTPGHLADMDIWVPGWPGTENGVRVPGQSTVVPDGSSWAVHGLGDAALPAEPPKKAAGAAEMFVMAGVAGLAVGLVAGLTWPKKKGAS